MWVEKELKHMKLKDKRLTKRLELILQTLADQPSESIPKACKSAAKTKGAYRFFSNSDVEAKEIREGFYQATIERIKEYQLILFLSDATNLVYSSHKSLRGAGVLRNFKARGFNLHTTFVITSEKLPLGVVNQHYWGRKPEDYGKRSERAKLPIEHKESYRWIESFQSAQQALPDHTQGIFIGDRGADFFELFTQPCKQNMRLLIRASHDRKSGKNKTIFQELNESDSTGTIEVLINRSGKRKERKAVLEIRYQNIVLPVPKTKNFASINVNIISAKEITSGVADPIDWKLITTLSINSFKDACYAVETYAKRWLIERYHYTLKEGCKVEQLQLEEAERINRAIATYTIVAWRIMFITYLARVDPNKSCAVVFSNDEWKTLYCYANNTPKDLVDPPSIYQAVRMLAKMGGFLGRKNDGEPGVKVIWQGFQALGPAVVVYCIFKDKIKDVGNA